MLRGQGANILNPAFLTCAATRSWRFGPAEDRRRAGAAREHHAKLDKQIQADEAKIKKFPGTFPSDSQRPGRQAKRDSRGEHEKRRHLLRGDAICSRLCTTRPSRLPGQLRLHAAEAQVPAGSTKAWRRYSRRARGGGRTARGPCGSERLTKIKDAVRKASYCRCPSCSSRGQAILWPTPANSNVRSYYLNSWRSPST